MDRLILELDAWTEAGVGLLQEDPKQFRTILEIVQAIVKVHRDPLSVSIEDSIAVPSAREAQGSG